MSLAQLQEVPLRKMILLVRPPGSGKSTFYQQTVLQSLAIDRPIIYATTEYGPSEAERALKERGLQEIKPDLLNFVNVRARLAAISPLVSSTDSFQLSRTDMSKRRSA